MSYIKEVNEELLQQNHKRIQEVSAKERRKTETTMNNDLVNGRIVNLWISHIWSNTDNEDIEWNGVVKKYRKSRNEVVVDYWQPGSDPENAESYDMSVFQLASNFYHDEFSFL